MPTYMLFPSKTDTHPDRRASTPFIGVRRRTRGRLAAEQIQPVGQARQVAPRCRWAVGVGLAMAKSHLSFLPGGLGLHRRYGGKGRSAAGAAASAGRDDVRGGDVRGGGEPQGGRG